LKILFLSHRIPFPPNKGEKIRTFHQLKYLCEQGHQISVLAPYESQDEVTFFQELQKHYAVRAEGVALTNKVYRLCSGLLKGKALSVSNFYSQKLQQQVDETLCQGQFDAVICTASSMAEYVFNSNAPCLVQHEISPRLYMDFMDLDSDKWRQYAQRASFPMSYVYRREQRLIAEFERQIVERFNACFFITDAETQLFKQNAPIANNIFAIENGIDTTAFKPAAVMPELAPPVLLFTGVMDYAPNIDAVLWFTEHVWQDILRRWPDAQFIVAGMNPNDKVQALTKTQGITVTGFVDDIMPYFARANIFVAPFRIARGVQNKVLQAFACGIPVISTPMGAEGIRCKQDESILLAESAEDFIKHIISLTTDAALYERISSNALSIIIEQYAWVSILHPFEQVIAGNITSTIQQTEHCQ
jgi:sugar transferase (PEP-CTERM/EpsH1 system associated)